MPLVRVVVEFMALVVIAAMPAVLVAVAFVPVATIVDDDRAGTVVVVVMMVTGAKADTAADENSEPPMPGKNVAQRGIHGLDDKRREVTWATEIPPADGDPPTGANGPNRLPMLAFPPARDDGAGAIARNPGV
jgi:hypothetical protein